MKRYVSFDFIRGVAIIGVLCFHVLNIAYNASDSLDKLASDIPGHLPFLFLVVIIGFVGDFDVLFVLLSSCVNVISIDKQWKKRGGILLKEMEALENPEEKMTAEMGKAHKKILKAQVIRGLFIVLMGYISEVLLNGMLLKFLLGEETFVIDSLKMIYFAQVLVMIGIGVIVSSILYLYYLKHKVERTTIKKQILIGIAAVLVLTPLLAELFYSIPFFTRRPSDLILDRSLGQNILVAFLVPLTTRFVPIFPNIIMSLVGLLFGMQISEGKVEKSALDELLKLSFFFYGIGFIIGILNAFMDVTTYALEGFLMPSAGALLILVLFFYLIDARGKGTKFAQKRLPQIIQRFSLMTLTIWSMQWITLLPMNIFHWVTITRAGTPMPFVEGPFYTRGLNGFQLCGYLVLILVFWYGILWLWGKADFRYSFEWITAKLMSGQRKDADKRLNLEESIYNLESLIEEKNEFYSKGQIAFLFILFILFGFFYVLLTLI